MLNQHVYFGPQFRVFFLFFFDHPAGMNYGAVVPAAEELAREVKARGQTAIESVRKPAKKSGETPAPV